MAEQIGPMNLLLKNCQPQPKTLPNSKVDSTDSSFEVEAEIADEQEGEELCASEAQIQAKLLELYKQNMEI